MALFGDGTRKILSNVEKFGSISRAAREMNMSYRQAWGHIKKVEARLGKKLVVSQKGGPGGGGGTRLSPEGRELVSRLNEFRERGQMALQKIFKEVFG